MWVTEESWPPIILVMTGAAIAGYLWWERRQARYSIAMAVCVAAAGAIFAIERSVVTERERVEQALQDIVAAYLREDSAAVVDAISRQAPELQVLARVALSQYVLTDASVSDVNIEAADPGETRFRSHFRVNGMAASREGAYREHVATRWIATWQKEGDRWRMLDLTMLNPITGEPSIDFRHALRTGTIWRSRPSS